MHESPRASVNGELPNGTTKVNREPQRADSIERGQKFISRHPYGHRQYDAAGSTELERQ